LLVLYTNALITCIVAGTFNFGVFTPIRASSNTMQQIEMKTAKSPNIWRTCKI